MKLLKRLKSYAESRTLLQEKKHIVKKKTNSL